MRQWLREVLDESSQRVDQWPEWKRKSADIDGAAIPGEKPLGSDDLGVVETAVETMVPPLIRTLHQ
jgi:hypothetical protein